MRVHAIGAVFIDRRCAGRHRLKEIVDAIQVIGIQVAADRRRTRVCIAHATGFDDRSRCGAGDQRRQVVNGDVGAAGCRLHRDGQRLHHLHRQLGATGERENEVTRSAVGHFALRVRLDRLEKLHIVLQLHAHSRVAPLRLSQLQPEGVKPGPTGVQVSRTRVLGQLVDQRITTRAAVKAVAAGATVDDVVART